jgi:hypothetical protein
MIAVIYLVLGYWAVGKTIYANKIVIGSMWIFFCRKLAYAMLFGWILIPIALLKLIFFRR